MHWQFFFWISQIFYKLNGIDPIFSNYPDYSCWEICDPSEAWHFWKVFKFPLWKEKVYYNGTGQEDSSLYSINFKTIFRKDNLGEWGVLYSALCKGWCVLIKYQPSGAGGTRSPPATPHRLQRRTACQWVPKWPTGSGKVSTPRFWGAPVNFR